MKRKSWFFFMTSWLLLSGVNALAQSQRFTFNSGEETLRQNLLHSVVKIVSKLKDGRAQKEGSGLIFRMENQDYVVTSDHVYFHSNELADHFIFVNGSTAPLSRCQSMMVRYEYGLALLKCETGISSPFEILRNPYNADPITRLGPIPMQAPGFERNPHYFRRDEIRGLSVAGYPLSSSELYVDRDGIGQLYYAEWGLLIMGIEIMYRIANVHAEPGMSGGLLFDRTLERGGMPRVLGLLSHMRNFSNGSNIYAIPAQDVIAFIYNSFMQPGFKPSIRQEVRNQLRGPYDVAIGSYDFELLEDLNAKNQRLRAYRLRKIGRFSDTPGPARIRDFESTLDIFLPKNPHCTPFMMGAWGLQPGNEYSYNYGLKLVSNGVDTLDGQVRGVEEPLFLLDCPETETSLEKLKNLRVRLAEILGRVKNETELIRHFRKIGQQLSDSHLDHAFSPNGIPLYYTELKARHFQKLIHDYRTPWAQLKEEGFETELRQWIKEVVDNLEKISL